MGHATKGTPVAPPHEAAWVTTFRTVHIGAGGSEVLLHVLLGMISKNAVVLLWYRQTGAWCVNSPA